MLVESTAVPSNGYSFFIDGDHQNILTSVFISDPNPRSETISENLLPSYYTLEIFIRIDDILYFLFSKSMLSFKAGTFKSIGDALEV